MSVQNLPIDVLRNKIARHKGVRIVTASFGAGKTLRVPKWLADHQNGPVLVITPKRRLAQAGANAMTAVYYDAGHPLRYGYCTTDDDTRHYDKNTQVLFCTPDIALKHDLVHTHNTFILDEYQEQSIKQTCISAILKRRLSDGDPVDITFMSATIDPAPLLEYWADHHPVVFSCEHPAPLVPIKEVGNGDPLGSISQLIEDGHTGIIVFVDGERSLSELNQRLPQMADSLRVKLHVSIAHSNMSTADLGEADRPTSEGCVRILITTNISESGVRYRWNPTAVVSTGIGKCYVEGDGVSTLYQTDLSQDRLLQQSGRVSDAMPNAIMLLHGTPLRSRPATWPAEHLRMPTEYLVKTAIDAGENPHKLDFGAGIGETDVVDAIARLVSLGVLDDNEKLTAAGRYAMRVPDMYRVGLMLYHASCISSQTLSDVILPAVAITAGKFYQQGNYRDREEGDEVAVMSLRTIVADIANTWGRPRGEIMDYVHTHKIAIRSLYDAHRRVTSIVTALGITPTLVRYRTLNQYAHIFNTEVEECILAGHIDMVYGMTNNRDGRLKCMDMEGNHLQYTPHHVPTGDRTRPFLAVARMKSNGVSPMRADAVCMIRDESLQKFIKRTPTPFRHDNHMHKRLIDIANTCLHQRERHNLLRMVSEWSEGGSDKQIDTVIDNSMFEEHSSLPDLPTPDAARRPRRRVVRDVLPPCAQTLLNASMMERIMRQ